MIINKQATMQSYENECMDIWGNVPGDHFAVKWGCAGAYLCSTKLTSL